MLRLHFFLFVFFLVSFVPSIRAEDDWGASHNLLLKSDINEDWFVISRSLLATRDNNEQVFLGYTGASLGYNIDENWSVRAGYRMARFKIGQNWRIERRPLTEIYYGGMHDGWRLSSRSRVEFRYPNWRPDDIRLRQEFTATAPWKFTSLGLKPFVEEEVFYSTRNKWIEANWATAGLSFFPNKNTKLKIGYRHNRLRIQGNFTTRHTLVTGVNIFF